MGRIAQEKRIMMCMIKVYCTKNHHQKQLCGECQELQDYALKRLEHCRYGERKSFCNQCPTHCYQKLRKEQIKRVMRFSGPRMIFYHPVIAFRHFFSK